jgi:phosphoribosyl-AMP cyclohydrolase
MVAWMNAETVAQTLNTGKATYWSRSRAQVWVKGETSGQHQRVVSLAKDCDSDTLLLTVEQTGNACHTGSHTCFDDQVTHPEVSQ